MKLNWIIFLLLFSGTAFAQSSEAENNIREGNEFYKQQQFDKAVSAYDKAIKNEPGNYHAKFNLANTLFKQNKLDDAVRLFDEVAGNTEKSDHRSRAYYNKGVVLSSQKKLEESIEAYKNALRFNSDDKEARENLQKALLELKKKKEEESKKKQQEKQQKQPQSKISPKEAQQRLQLLAQKEKEVQQRIQKEKSKPGGNQTKDW